MTSAAGPGNQEKPVHADKAGLIERIAYGSGNFASQMVFNPATAFMVFFYTDIAGIAASTVGTLLLVSRLLDIFNPVMGLVVDRTHTRMGKARPWLLWMAIPFGISAVLLFTVPNVGPTGRLIYAFITYNLAFTVVYAAVDTPYSSMLPLMTSDSHNRTMLSLSRMTLANCGIVLSFMVTLPLVRVFGGGAVGWQHAFMVFGTLATVLLLGCFAFTKERIKPAAERAKVPIKAGLVSMITNKYWLLLMLLAMLLFVTLGLYGANIYFCRFFLHDAERLGPMMTILVVAQIAGMLVSGPIVKKFGKRNCALAGTGISIAGQLVMYIAPTSYAVVIIGTVIKGLGAAPLVGTMFAMVADVIDYGEWRSGLRVDGLTFGSMALGMKMAAGLGGALTGWVLGWGGYVAGSLTQQPRAMFAIKALFLHIPLVLLLLAAVVLWMYGLDRQYHSINADLELRRATTDVG